MARRAVIIAALGLALAAVETAQAVTNTGTIYHSVTVQPNTVQSITVTCPAGFVAVTGGMAVGKLLFTGGAGPLLSSTRSAAGNAFTFRVGVPATGVAQTLTLSVRCIRIGFKIPGAVLKLKGGKGTKAVMLAPGATRSVKVACPAGQAPTGEGYDERPADQPRSADARGAGTLPEYPLRASGRLVVSMPVTGGWRFTAHDYGSRPVSMVLEVDCLKRSYARRLPDHRLARRDETIIRQTTHNTLEGHSHFVVHARCPRGFEPLGSGFAFEGLPDVIPLAAPGRGADQFLFEFLNGEMRRLAVQEYELCRVERSYVG